NQLTTYLPKILFLACLFWLSCTDEQSDSTIPLDRNSSESSIEIENAILYYKQLKSREGDFVNMKRYEVKPSLSGKRSAYKGNSLSDIVNRKHVLTRRATKYTTTKANIVE